MKENMLIEQEYKQFTHTQQILERPDTYIGSTKSKVEEMYIFQNGNIVLKEVEYVPGFLKIFDEILVNAADNNSRDMSMTYIKVKIGEKMISVRNDGCPIKVAIHKVCECYVPEMLFGILLTGSNFDDEEKRVVGGRNGYGAKLTNIYSKKFIVDVCDGQQKFQMVWLHNMILRLPPNIQKCTESPFVQISYEPDLQKFKMGSIQEMEGLLFKRVYDMAGIFSGLKVYLNDQLIEVNSFPQYVNLYLKEEAIVYDPKMKSNRWEVACSFSKKQFKQVSFVNSIHTSQGGTHVSYCTNKILEKVMEEIGKQDKYKELDVKKSKIKKHLQIFINCSIDNPLFDSQMKQCLITKENHFGGPLQDQFTVTKVFLDNFISNIIEIIDERAKEKQICQQRNKRPRQGKKKVNIYGIRMLEDANDAGKKNSELCTLILTEGESAKCFAMSGLDVVGRDRYGVYALRGKLLNVRNVQPYEIMKNEQIQDIVRILGLNYQQKYEDVKQLRYGSIMIMADQDIDGSYQRINYKFNIMLLAKLIQTKRFFKRICNSTNQGNQRQLKKRILYGLRFQDLCQQQ
ncbi:hypothetical protein pb186bvf_020676 [Paramecium bursaria]